MPGQLRDDGQQVRLFAPYWWNDGIGERAFKVPAAVKNLQVIECAPRTRGDGPKGGGAPVPSLGRLCVASAQDPGTVTAGRRFDDAVYLRCGMWARWSYDEPFGGRPVGLWLW